MLRVNTVGNVGRHEERTAEKPANPPPLPPLPVTIRCGSATLAGYAEILSETEVLVQALEEMPPLDGECEVVFELSKGSVTARGRLLTIDPNARLLRISLDRI